MEVNKDEAERCIQLAESYIHECKRDKAEKFLHKAERLYPTERAKGFIHLCLYTDVVFTLCNSSRITCQNQVDGSGS